MDQFEPSSLNLTIGKILFGKNPRRYFDERELSDLANSIRAQGVLQPILVRGTHAGHELVAGERRLRAAQMVYGPEGTIPAIVRDMTDEEAESAALNENIMRSNMSAAEESDASAKLVADLNGDRDEAARRLGWSRDTLEKRLVLQHATASVRQALTERKILLGHAELLAAAPEESQEKVLPLILEKGITVADLRTNLQAKTKRLSTACFDKTECAACHHNSDRQMTFLEANVGSGFCTNWGCFDNKTASHVHAIAAELKEEVPNVRVLDMGDVRGVTAVSADDLGEAQAEACKGCKDYGASVSKVAGSEGEVKRGQCFNLTCHVKKAAAFIKSKEPQPAEQKTNSASAAKPSTAKAAAKPRATASTSVNSIPNKVDEYRYVTWRNIARRTVGNNAQKALAVLFAFLLEGDGENISTEKIEGAWENVFTEAKPKDLGERLTFAANITEQGRELTARALAASLMDNIDKRKIPVLLAHLEISMKDVWKLSAEYLNLLTKSEMEALATEIGLKAHLGDKTSKLFSGKRDEIIAKFLKVEGFDYTGIVPQAMQYESTLKNA